MKYFLPFLVLMALLPEPVSAQTPPAAPPVAGASVPPAKPETVQTEDGRSLFGLVTIKDDYTIVITTDTGVTNLPIAALKGDSWKKYSEDKDREGDGRFWSERQDALTRKWEKGGKSQPLDAVLAEVASHLPDIVTYKQSQPLADAKKPGGPQQQPSPPNAGSTIEIKLFSAPGGFGSSNPSIPSLPGQIPSSVPSAPSIPSLP